jgi:ATP-binding cassette subfamily B protein/subfamily B ATP-binding cassette protein MsbA
MTAAARPGRAGTFSSVLVVLRYARRYLRHLSLATGATIALVGLQLLVPLIVNRLVSGVGDTVEHSAPLSLVTALAGGLLALYLVRALLRFTSSYMSHSAGWGVVADARRDVYEHLQGLSMRFYEDQQTGQLMSRLVNDTDKFENLISHAVPDILVNLLTLLGVSAMMFVMDWRLALLTLIPIPLVVLAARSYARYVAPAFRARQQDLAELNATLQDNLAGMREIKAFSGEDREARRIGGKIEQYRASLLRALRLMATFTPFVEFASSLGTVVVIYFGGRLAFQKMLSVGDLVAFFLYLEMFYGPVRALSGVQEQIQEARVGSERVADLLNETPDITDRPGAHPLSARAGGAIRLHDVSFRYSRGEMVLEHIDLEIPARSTVALVGPSGVGKTTLASLVPRFYDPTEGSLSLDGKDLRDIELRSLRRQVSVVLQDVFLFHGNVRENILFGRPDATDAEMREAARVANAHEFIEQLPDGYDTLIGERGIKLSGGQKQRISIARAVLKDAPVLILDEATSSVDTQTEVLIRQALERLMQGRTVLIIAHRLSTIRSADMIAVLENRRLRELGTHEELMGLNGLYRTLSSLQDSDAAADRLTAV